MSLPQFILPFEDFASLIPADDLNEEVVIVSIFGKSCIGSENRYPDPISVVLGNYPVGDEIEDTDTDQICRIEGKYISEEKVLYLNLVGPYGTKHLIHLFKNMNCEMKQKGFLYSWNKFKNRYGRALLLLFLVSHIVIINDPTSSPDFSLVQLLKIMSYIRPKYQTAVSNLLSKGISHGGRFSCGRLCAPRLLFIFSCPHDILMEEDQNELMFRVKKLEHSLEDQLYIAFRKSRVAKNVCNRALFSIAPNDEFVFVDTNDVPLYNTLDYNYKRFYDSLKHRIPTSTELFKSSAMFPCTQPTYPQPLLTEWLSGGLLSDPQLPTEITTNGTGRHSKDFAQEWMWRKKPGSTQPSLQRIDDVVLLNHRFSSLNIVQQRYSVCQPALHYPEMMPPFPLSDDPLSLNSDSSSSSGSDDGCLEFMYDATTITKKSHTLKRFLQKHISKAHTDGFYDNMGKYVNIKPFFERPTLKVWITTVNAILGDPEVGLCNTNAGPSVYLSKLLGTELQFSTARCKKVIPLAVALYQENLPPYYNSAVHEKQVKKAIAVFIHHARGPEQEKYIFQLREECDKIWKSGRQTCEVLSLFGNSCTKPMHQPANGDLHLLVHKTESDHWNGITYICCCNCGMRQCSRPDPFTLKAANYDFYHSVSLDCCSGLEKFTFPVFQPSTHEFRAAVVKNYEAYEGSMKNGGELVTRSHSAHTLSIGNIGKLWVTDDSAPVNGETTPLSPLSDQAMQLVLDYSNFSQTDKHLVRQASTTEYLPGMVHLESPLGLLPRYPSWSLVCRGPSSLYSHNLGLHDQPGFIQGSSYLLPWDVTIREKDCGVNDVCESVKKQLSGHSSRGSFKKHQKAAKDLVTVKIFVGVEYECLRGHRFMSSAPGKVLKTTGNGTVKETANRVTKGNMPLYLPCPCGKMLAQLMRIHVVTPKAPVFVTIEPKVRPAPKPCPVFVTGEQKPIALSQSAYWVLRLPFIYATERNHYVLPSRLKKIKYAELLGPMYGISQVPD